MQVKNQVTINKLSGGEIAFKCVGSLTFKKYSPGLDRFIDALLDNGKVVSREKVEAGWKVEIFEICNAVH